VTGADATASFAPTRDDELLVELLRAGDEDAFMTLVERYGPQMLRIARLYVPTTAVAEDVVAETWLAMLAGLDRFEGRSSLKTWIFRILANRAKTRGLRERRSVPFSSLGDAADDDGPTVDPERFQPAGSGRAGHWSTSPQRFGELPEERLLSKETAEAARAAIAALPESQRTVITLRDVEGWDAAEVRDLLGLTDGNQRVLLHRARAKVRQALERELDG
jgi:RNA polymerase sigma-70 factor (ECF subfamily)